MRLSEISDEDKLILSLKGIQYDFVADFQTVITALSLVGKSLHRRSMLSADIAQLMLFVNLFLNQGFDENDPDVIIASGIYEKLSAIKNQL